MLLLPPLLSITLASYYETTHRRCSAVIFMAFKLGLGYLRSISLHHGYKKLPSWNRLSLLFAPQCRGFVVS